MKELNISTNIPKCLNADDIQAILKLSLFHALPLF